MACNYLAKSQSGLWYPKGVEAALFGLALMALVSGCTNKPEASLHEVQPGGGKVWVNIQEKWLATAATNRIGLGALEICRQVLERQLGLKPVADQNEPHQTVIDLLILFVGTNNASGGSEIATGGPVEVEVRCSATRSGKVISQRVVRGRLSDVGGQGLVGGLTGGDRFRELVLRDYVLKGLVLLIYDFHGLERLLAMALTEDEVLVREAATLALAELKQTQTLELLKDYLSDPRPWLRERAVSLLGLVPDRRRIPLLVEAMHDPSYSVRWTAVRTAAEVADAGTFDALCEALNDKEQLVREAAALGLGRMRDLRAVKPLVNLLGTDDFLVRQAVIRALAELLAGRITPTVLRDLEERLDDPNELVREGVVEVLAKLRDPSTMEILVEALQDKYEPIRELSAAVLESMTGQGLGTDYEKWRAWLEASSKRE